MMPLGDNNELRKSVPVVTYVLIILNILVFLLELGLGEEFIVKWAFTPSRFMSDPAANVATLFTSMFMHAGWGHLIGNMLYLWIFGDNVEDRFGKVKYLIFYLSCGITASLAQFLFSSATNLPNLGASGAIAGVLGAYMVLFPKGQVSVLLFNRVVQMPAYLVIGFWFLLQFLSVIGSSASTTGDTGGVAYMAHVGGFVAGIILTFGILAFSRNDKKFG